MTSCQLARPTDCIRAGMSKIKLNIGVEGLGPVGTFNNAFYYSMLIQCWSIILIIDQPQIRECKKICISTSGMISKTLTMVMKKIDEHGFICAPVCKYFHGTQRWNSRKHHTHLNEKVSSRIEKENH